MDNSARRTSRARFSITPRSSQDSWDYKFEKQKPQFLKILRLKTSKLGYKNRKFSLSPSSQAIDDLICLDPYEYYEDATPRIDITREVLRSTITDHLRVIGSQLDVFRDIGEERLDSLQFSSAFEKNLAFQAAALLNKHTVFDKLLSLGVDVNYQESKYSFTALHVASFCGFVLFCDKLLTKTSKQNLLIGVYSPLHLAALGGQSEIIQKLLEAGANIDRLYQAGESALGCAVRSKNPHCVKTLVNAGADVNILDGYGYSPLHQATDLGNVPIVKILLESGRCQVDATTRLENNSALHLAAANGFNEIVELLLKFGAVPDVCNARHKTPLHFSVKACLESTNLLLQCNADPNATDADMRTPLHSAVATSENWFGADILRLLIKCQTDINAQDRYGYSALHIAALNELADCAEVLVSHGADVTIKTKGGTAALGLIARKTPSALNAIKQHLDTYITYSDPEVSCRSVQLKFNFKYLQQGNQRGEMHFLKTVVEEGQQQILEHPLCEAFLHLKWQRIRIYYLARLLFCFIHTCLLSVYVLLVLAYKCHEPLSLDSDSPGVCESKSKFGAWLRENPQFIENEWRILVLFTFFAFCRKLYGITSYNSVKQYFNLSNIVEWYVLASIPATSYMLLSGEWQSHVGAFAVLVGWANLMVNFGNLPVFGVYVAMYTSVQKQFTKMLSAYIFLLIGFTVSFCAIFVESDAFDNPFVGFVKILVMMTGEFDFGNLLEDINKGDDENGQILKISGLILFVMFLLFVTIILINLLIGIAVHDIQGLQKTAGLSKLVGLTNLMFYIEAALFGPRVPKFCVEFLNSAAKVPSLVSVSPLSLKEARLPREILRAGWEVVKKDRSSWDERRKAFSLVKSENVAESDLGELLEMVARLTNEVKELKDVVAAKIPGLSF